MAKKRSERWNKLSPRAKLGVVVGGVVVVIAAVSIFTTGGSGGGESVQGFCSDLVKLQGTLHDLGQGILTNAEAVDQLASEEDNLSLDADTLTQDGETNRANAASDLSLAIGHIKVALADGGDISTPITELNQAIAVTPACP